VSFWEFAVFFDTFFNRPKAYFVCFEPSIFGREFGVGYRAKAFFQIALMFIN